MHNKLKGIQQCGSCLHLDREKQLSERHVCAMVGKLPTSKACSNARPDLYAMTDNEVQINDLELVADAMSRMSARQLDIMSGLMQVERRTRKFGWKFYQRVYVRYIGASSSNYLSNFISARILDVDKTTIRMVGESRSGTVYLSYEHDGSGNCDSIYSAKLFADLRKQMIAKGHYVDSRIPLPRMAPTSQQGGVATYDEAEKAGVLPAKHLRHKRNAPDDLVTLVNNMSRSHSEWDTEPKRRSGKGKRRSKDSEVVVDWRKEVN